MSYDIYATHAPVLADVLARTGGPVLELGCGWGSTPLLHAMCRNKRMLVTLDTDQEWLDRFAALKTPGHRFRAVPKSWDVSIGPANWTGGHGIWGAVLVDCAPGEMRTPLIERLCDVARFVVVHDSEKDYGSGADYKYERVMPRFRYASEYRFLRPYTLVLSNFEPYHLDDGEAVWTPPKTS